jgi:hypothetical protein
MNIRVSSQNLNEARDGSVIGSKLWRGRAWFRKKSSYDELLHVEWMFGKYARDFAISATVGYGDSDSGICLHACIPWLISFFIVVPHAYRCRESKTGIGIHNGGFWIYPFTDQHESRRDFPWWKKCYCWRFPWDLDWHRTDILTHDTPSTARSIYTETKGNRTKLGDWDRRDAIHKSVARDYTYRYSLKSGEMQERIATVWVERMEWRARWYPIIWRRKIRTSIDIKFNAEVGERSGSWKGGCTGCGYEMRPHETPEECLRRMESERVFN